MLHPATRTEPDNRLDDYLRKHRHEYIWQNKLATLPYGAECAALWESSSVDGAAANDALTCFAVSQDEASVRSSASTRLKAAFAPSCPFAGDNLRLSGSRVWRASQAITVLVPLPLRRSGSF